MEGKSLDSLTQASLEKLDLKEKRTNRKILPAVLMLACAPLAVGNSNPGYPSGKLAQFVVEKLDVTTLPQELRPGQAKGKKTLEQYWFVPVAITESEAVLRNAAGPSEIVIRVLEQRASGIYVCARRRQKTALQMPTSNVYCCSSRKVQTAF